MDDDKLNEIESVMVEIRKKLEEGIAHGFFDLNVSGEISKGQKRAITMSLALRVRRYVQPNMKK